MPLVTEGLVGEGHELVEEAQRLRAEHRHRNRPDRLEELAGAVARINDYQKRIRPLIAQATYQPVMYEEDLRELSDRLQRERRKLRKMLYKTNGHAALEGSWS